LREAQDRINQLEREAEGLDDQLLAEAKTIIEEARSMPTLESTGQFGRPTSASTASRLMHTIRLGAYKTS
jgi:hypothetical protein